MASSGRFRCYQCPRRGARHHEFEADGPACPKCGAGPPAVVELADVHFLAADPEGRVESSGRRWSVACDPKREVMAEYEGDDYHCSHDPRAVTCPSCLTTPAWCRAAKQVRELKPVLASRAGKCC